MNAKTLLFLLAVSVTGWHSNAQGAYISLSAGECELCRTCAQDVYERVAKRWLGPVWVVLPTGIEDIDAPVLRNSLGWDLDDRSKPVVADPELFEQCNPGARGYLTITGPDEELWFQAPLTNVVHQVDLDSLLPLLNQRWIDAWKSKSRTISVDDRYYTLLFNEPLRAYPDSTLLFFNESYLPWKLWWLQPNGGVRRWPLEMDRDQWNAMASLFDYPPCSESQWATLQKKLKRERLTPLSLTNIVWPADSSRLFLCAGNFYGLSPDGKELIYSSAIFELDDEGNVHNLRPFPDTIAGTDFRCLRVRIPVSQSLCFADNKLHVRVYHPALIDRQDLSLPEDTLLPASARFSVVPSIVFEGFDSLFIPQVQIRNRAFYFNSWSRFVHLADGTGIIFLLAPNELQLSGKEFRRISLHPISPDGQLFYTFVLDSDILVRIAKEGDNFNLYFDQIGTEQDTAVFSEQYALGPLLNPMFLYQQGSLYIVSSLPKKTMEMRRIPFRHAWPD